MRLALFKSYLKKCKLFGFYLLITKIVIGSHCGIIKAIYFFKLKKHKKKHFSCSQTRILIVLTDGGIGNIIEATPLIQAVRSYFPQGNISVLTTTPELFENWCIPDYVTADPNTLKTTFDYTFFAYWQRRPLPEWSQRIQLGKVLMPKKRLCKWFLKQERYIYLDLLKKVGYKGCTPPLYVSIKKPKLEDIPIENYICIVPGGRNDRLWRFKKWPYYQELISLLLKSYPEYRICIVGTKTDEIAAESLNNVLDLRGRLLLNESAWVFKHSSLVIGNDCGPMHIASAVNAPSIVIFGPSCVIKNAYMGSTVMVYPQNVKCWPCQYYTQKMERCSTGECIKSIIPEFVMGYVKIFL